jgi:hypothetical protein
MSFWLFLTWENVKIAIFDGRALALDETAEVKEEDVRNKSTKLIWQYNSIIVLFTFVIITVKMMNKMLVE